MITSRIWFAAILTLVTVPLTLTTASAQTNPRQLGGGCSGNLAPTLTGSFTIGSTLTIDPFGCIDSPGSTRFILFGIELPQPRISIPLMTSIVTTQLCEISVNPIIAVGDFSRGFGPVSIAVPNDPVWRGFPLAIGAYCVECGFAGCFPTLSAGVEVTFQ
jgi:hypothetical protein